MFSFLTPAEKRGGVILNEEGNDSRILNLVAEKDHGNDFKWQNGSYSFYNRGPFFFFFLIYIYVIYLFIHLFIYFFNFWLCWVLVSVRGPSASGGRSPSRCAGLSPSRPLLLRSTGSRRAGPAAVAHGPSRSAARGIFPDQGSNLRPPHQQADSQPLRHQGSPRGPSWSIFDLKNILVQNNFGFVITLNWNPWISWINYHTGPLSHMEALLPYLFSRDWG